MITTQILLIERKVECGRSDDSDLLRRRRQHARASCAYSVKRMYGIDKGVDCATMRLTTRTDTALRLRLARPQSLARRGRPPSPNASRSFAASCFSSAGSACAAVFSSSKSSFASQAAVPGMSCLWS